jgi:hypothetical protein
MMFFSRGRPAASLLFNVPVKFKINHMLLSIRQRPKNNNPNMKLIFYLNLGDQAGMTK